MQTIKQKFKKSLSQGTELILGVNIDLTCCRYEWAPWLLIKGLFWWWFKFDYLGRSTQIPLWDGRGFLCSGLGGFFVR